MREGVGSDEVQVSDQAEPIWSPRAIRNYQLHHFDGYPPLSLSLPSSLLPPPGSNKSQTVLSSNMYYIVCRGHTRIQLRVDKKLLHDIVTRRLGVAEW